LYAVSFLRQYCRSFGKSPYRVCPYWHWDSGRLGHSFGLRRFTSFFGVEQRSQTLLVAPAGDSRRLPQGCWMARKVTFAPLTAGQSSAATFANGLINQVVRSDQKSPFVLSRARDGPQVRARATAPPRDSGVQLSIRVQIFDAKNVPGGTTLQAVSQPSTLTLP
jgi:hypothetical protein